MRRTDNLARAVAETPEDTPAPETHRTIGDMRRRFGVTARTLRFYEQRGLVTPAREGDRRLYRPADIARLDTVVQLRACGIPVGEVYDVLERGADLAAVIRSREAALVEERAALKEQARELDRLKAEMHDDRFADIQGGRATT